MQKSLVILRKTATYPSPNPIIDKIYLFHRVFSYISLDTLHMIARLEYPHLKALIHSSPLISRLGCTKGKMMRSPFHQNRDNMMPGESLLDTFSWCVKSHNGHNYFFLHFETKPHDIWHVILLKCWKKKESVKNKPAQHHSTHANTNRKFSS